MNAVAKLFPSKPAAGADAVDEVPAEIVKVRAAIGGVSTKRLRAAEDRVTAAREALAAGAAKRAEMFAQVDRTSRSSEHRHNAEQTAKNADAAIVDLEKAIHAALAHLEAERQNYADALRAAVAKNIAWAAVEFSAAVEKIDAAGAVLAEIDRAGWSTAHAGAIGNALARQSTARRVSRHAQELKEIAGRL